MSLVEFNRRRRGYRIGLKGPRAADWLEARGLTLPPVNRWSAAAGDAWLVARLGTSEFFLEDAAAGGGLHGIAAALETPQPGVYPVLREDAAFLLSGPGSDDVLAQVCNVNFADLELASRPVIITLMIGVSVLVVPQIENARPRYRIWCDPTFGQYLEESLGMVVMESGGNYRRSTCGEAQE